jgi:tRNA uridine 5-carboxymethylaminomethyl modification enzyme
MISDLVNKTINEPYRITPSYSEFRLSIREDNADIRLTNMGRKIGLVDDARWAVYEEKMEELQRGRKIIDTETITPKIETLAKLIILEYPEIHQAFTLKDLLKRADYNYEMIENLSTSFHSLSTDVKEELEIDSKYEGYIIHENNEISRLTKILDNKIPDDVDYSKMESLSKDGRSSLINHRPVTFREASQLPNVKPSDMITILSYLKMKK